MNSPGATSDSDNARLDDLYRRLGEASRTFVGYPCNQRFDYSHLHRFLKFAANNVGDPFAPGCRLRLNTHDFEREVIADFVELTRAKKDQCWGYVTNGGTEGNMYGLYLARELHPEGMVYFSEDTHYSVAKILRLLHARSIMIKCLPNGEMDCDDLRETIRIHRDVPPIIFANIGTTMQGAIDDLAEIKRILADLRIPEHYIHCDAALSGMILPFVDDPQPFDFTDGADSISISGHKFIGAPIPCGVALARKRNVDRIARSVEYVGALDTTISGSRNAFTPLVLWSALRSMSKPDFRSVVAECQELADYAIARFNARGVEAWRNRNSITVVFPRPSEPVFKKWQFAPQRDIGHLITMPHITREIVDEFVADVADDLGSSDASANRNDAQGT